MRPTSRRGNICWFAPETHARSGKQRIELASKLFCIAQSVRFFRAPTTPSTTKTTTTKAELTDERSFGESRRATPRARKYCRVSILDPHQEWSPRGLLQSLRPVTLGHSRVNGTRRSSSKLVGHPPGGVMASLIAGRCFRNSPLIRLRAPPLSPGAVCKLHMYRACVRLHKCRGQLYATRCHG